MNQNKNVLAKLNLVFNSSLISFTVLNLNALILFWNALSNLLLA